ncbi:MAG: DUF4173 domain-containing protein [Anaerolineales bacterium]|nr:DUF4173 domain-containing protein [Anaerolineales bacterium]
MVKRNWIWWIALAAAFSFDFLFWGHRPGISFFLFIVVCLAAGAVSAAVSGIRPHLRSLILVPCILAAAAVTFLRTEPFTVFCGAAAALGLMMILAETYRGGRWPFYGWIDHIGAAFRLGASAALHPALLPPEKPAEGALPRPNAWRRWMPSVARGLVLALPVVLVFAALLSAADPVFERALNSVFDIDRLPEYLFRATYVLIGMYLLTGIILHAVLSSREERLAAPENPHVRPFVGFIESVVVLLSVSLLFAVFVAIQFRYFFGGAENITAEGFTYSEYARRGFGELVAVAFFSLVLFLGLGSLTRRENAFQRKAFSGLGLILAALVVVMLVSSFRRLQLYEEAYGFTALRLYTNVFILWLGILLVAAAGLELAGRTRCFSAAALAAAFGFTLSLAVLNVDAAIVRWNGLRAVRFEVEGASARAEEQLDTEYFESLSADAVPELLALYRTSAVPEKDQIGAGLSCRLAAMEEESAEDWRSYLWPVAEGLRLLRASGVAEAYPTHTERGVWYVQVGGESRRCAGQEMWMD